MKGNLDYKGRHFYSNYDSNQIPFQPNAHQPNRMPAPDIANRNKGKEP